jgi:hypothetical protein
LEARQDCIHVNGFGFRFDFVLGLAQDLHRAVHVAERDGIP